MGVTVLTGFFGDYRLNFSLLFSRLYPLRFIYSEAKSIT